MNLSVEQVALVLGIGSSIATAIFWGALFVGRVMGRLEAVERKVQEHDEVIAEFKAGV